MTWTALIALGTPGACNVAARNERGQVVLLRVEGGELIGSKPVAEFLPDDRQDEAAQQLWVLAASAKWEYDSFGEPLSEADTLEALAALVPGRGFGGGPGRSA